MRLCRFRHEGVVQIGFYGDVHVLPLSKANAAYRQATHETLPLPESDALLEFLPPAGPHFEHTRKLAAWADTSGQEILKPLQLPVASVELLTPIPNPNKLFLLAGNYAKHIEEGGRKAAEREETFPYVFMKPASTTLTNPGGVVHIPKVSPDHIDWELELAVIIGKKCKHVKEAEALQFVAGYTVVNDISNRKFRPNPGRKERDMDRFFDWLHGKWADSFCPCGPCVASADAIPDPQNLKLELKLNGEVRQDATTQQQIFPVAAVIEFISSFVTLEPGDIIATGTPAGVGNTTGTYLKPGDKLEAFISSIGTLVSVVEAEA